MSDETPSPSPPSPSEEASSAASARDSGSAPSTSRAAAGAFIADPGPAFDAKAAGDAPPPPVAPLEPPPGWEEPAVRSILTAQGAVLHGAIGKSDEDWVYLEHELDAIAPPLTRILNRYDATRAAAGTGDELALMIGLTGYVSRSYMERRAALMATYAEPEPITGVHADGRRPEDDPGQQAAMGLAPDWRTGE